MRAYLVLASYSLLTLRFFLSRLEDDFRSYGYSLPELLVRARRGERDGEGKGEEGEGVWLPMKLM